MSSSAIDNAASGAGAQGLEIWSLDHPEHGRIDVRVGYDPAFAAQDSSWPGELPKRFAHRDGQRALPDAESSLWQRGRSRLDNPPVRAEIRLNGEIQNQYENLDNGRFPLRGPGVKKSLSPAIAIGVDRSKPHLKFTVSPFKELLQVEFREGDQLVEFDPPTGSRGAKRRETMQSSAVKRALIPMAEGLGKGGWALLVLVLGPVVGRILSKLLDYLPDVELPDWSMPHLDLPLPDFPHLQLPTPTIDLPDIALPELPEWAQWLGEYSKIWVPVVVGIVLGFVALRNHRKSEAQKQQWNSLNPGDDAARAQTDARPGKQAEQSIQPEAE